MDSKNRISDVLAAKKTKHIRRLLMACFLLIFCMAALILSWTIEVGKDMTKTGNLICQLVDIGQNGSLRVIYEKVRGNRRLFFTDGTSFYVPENEFNKCWDVNPWKLNDDGFVNNITLNYRKLILGGDSVAHILDIKKPEGITEIRKGKATITPLVL